MRHRLKIQNFCFLALLLLWGAPAKAQLSTKDSTRSAQLWALCPGTVHPMGAVAQTYSTVASADVEYLRKTREGIFYGVQFKALYGNAVKNADSIFSGLTDGDGNFLGVNGEFANIQAGMSGGMLMVELGKLFAPKYNPNSGWLWIQGIGVAQHKIGLRDQRGTLPQLQSPFIEGYDRLHLGGYTTSSLRYLHLDNNERVNWSINVNASLGVSRSIRGFNIDSGMADTNFKFDAFLGCSFQWYIPIYQEQESFYLVD